MFEARLTEGKTFKLIIEALKDLVTDTNIECSADDLSIQCMDSAHVALVAVQLNGSAFDIFRCDRPLALGINSANLSKIFKMMNGDDVLILKCEDEPEHLTLLFEASNGNTVADFDLKLMDIETENVNIPDMEYACNIRMPSGEFQRIVRDMQVLGDTCTIGVSKEGVKFSSQGDMGTGNILIRPNSATDKEEEKVVVDMGEPVELNFALRYLNMFTKATPLSRSVNISMSPNVPVVIDYPIDGESGTTGYVKFFLAPKIEDGDEDGDDQ